MRLMHNCRYHILTVFALLLCVVADDKVCCHLTWLVAEILVYVQTFGREVPHLFESVALIYIFFCALNIPLHCVIILADFIYRAENDLMD